MNYSIVSFVIGSYKTKKAVTEKSMTAFLGRQVYNSIKALSPLFLQPSPHWFIVIF